MPMEFDGDFESPRPPEELWNYFTDTEHLADCAPGMKEMNLVTSSEFEAVITVGVGSVKPTFDVEGVIAEAEEPDKLVMSAEGSAGRKGAFDTVATMRLDEIEDGTRLDWEAEANVSGLISSLGQRALGSVTTRLVGQFFDCMQEKIESGVEAESELTAASEAELSVD